MKRHGKNGLQADGRPSDAPAISLRAPWFSPDVTEIPHPLRKKGGAIPSFERGRFRGISALKVCSVTIKRVTRRQRIREDVLLVQPIRPFCDVVKLFLEQSSLQTCQYGRISFAVANNWVHHVVDPLEMLPWKKGLSVLITEGLCPAHADLDGYAGIANVIELRLKTVTWKLSTPYLCKSLGRSRAKADKKVYSKRERVCGRPSEESKKSASIRGFHLRETSEGQAKPDPSDP